MTISKQDEALLDAIDQSSTMDLHRSNLLRMQVTELLQECRLDMEEVKWAADAQEYLQMLSTKIRGLFMKEKSFQELADKPVSLQVGDDISLSVEPIGCTRARGGWTKKAGNAHVLPTFEVMVKIPEAAMAKKDFWNHRYFDKRTVVANRVAKALQKERRRFGEVEFVWTRGMNCPPLLRLLPPTKKSHKFQIHLHFGMQSIDWIPKLRLVPNRENIKRPAMECQFYNHCLLFDARHEFEDLHLHGVFEHRNFEEALILVQIWGLQRGLWRNHDGWDANTVALFIVYLLRTRKINARMTNLQIFTVLIQTWANTNWLGEEQSEEPTVRAAMGEKALRKKTGQRTVLVLPLEGQSEQQTIADSDLAEIYAKQTRESPLTSHDAPDLLSCYAGNSTYALGPVFLDPTMTYNYLGHVSPNFSRLLQSHARQSLEALQQPWSAFDYLFMRQSRFWQQWDMYFRVEAESAQSNSWEFSTRHLLEKLESGLGNRITGMRVLTNGNSKLEKAKADTDAFPKTSVEGKKKAQSYQHKSPSGTDFIVIGLSVNPETCQRIVDRGPPPEQSQNAKRFSDLWGPKAQLRRFKDGAVVPAVVWNDVSRDLEFQNNGRWNGGYVDTIIKHLVALHHSEAAVSFGLPGVLAAIDSMSSGNSNHDPWLAHTKVLKSFEKLSEFLRKSTELYAPGMMPIHIDDVEALSPSLRYSQLYPPLPHPFLGASSSSDTKVAGAIPSDPIVIQLKFRSSSKWPTDLKAIGAAKTAMLLQLAKCLESLAVPDFDGPVVVTPTALELGYQGFCFRLMVKPEPEIIMLQKLESPSAEAISILRHLREDHILANRHHVLIQALHTRHPSASGVVRMAKRWVASHLLSGQIGGELVELLVSKIYSKGVAVLEPPSTVSSGFCRFLHLLATYDWKNSPLVVDPRGVLTDDDHHSIYATFDTRRGVSKETGPPMYVVAPYNGPDDADASDADLSSDNSNWSPTVASPEWVVVTRAAQLAKRSYDIASTCLFSFDDSEWGDIFTESQSSLQAYNVLFRVDSDFVVENYSSSTTDHVSLTADNQEDESAYSKSMKSRSRGPSALRSKLYRNLRQDGKSNVILSWQPVSILVQELQRRFGQYALFFYNEFCPEVIGMVWRPQFFSEYAFSALTSEHTRPHDDELKPDGLMSKNAGDVLREMKELMQHIVTDMRVFDSRVQSPHRKRKRLSTSA